MPGTVAGVVALAAVLDLAEAYRLSLDGDAVALLLGGGPGDVPERYAITDPAVLGTPPVPITLIHGDVDQRVPAGMSRRFSAATGATLIELPGVDHFALIDPSSTAWPTVRAAVHAAVQAAVEAAVRSAAGTATAVRHPTGTRRSA
jgi:pimeloyl-ACP methyl ester carboxylesterase